MAAGQPARLVSGRPGPAGERAELARRLGRRRVGLLQPGRDLGQHLPGLLLVLERRRELPLGPLAAALGVADLTTRPDWPPRAG